MIASIEFDLPATMISGIALIVSVVALLQGVRHRILDRSLLAHEKHARLSRDLTRFVADAHELKLEWRATQSFLTGRNSGAMIQRDTDLDRILSSTERLIEEVAGIVLKSEGLWQGASVERSLRKLTTARAEADDLAADLGRHRDELLQARQRLSRN